MSGNWIKYSNTASLYSCWLAMRQLSESIHPSLPSVQSWRILIWEDRAGEGGSDLSCHLTSCLSHRGGHCDIKQLVISQSIGKIQTRSDLIRHIKHQTLNQREIEKDNGRSSDCKVEIKNKIMLTFDCIFLFVHPLNFIDILFSASQLSITLRNSSKEIRSSCQSDFIKIIHFIIIFTT